MWQLFSRVNAALSSALSITSLLISFATALSHFKPNLYLEISLRWKNKVAIPVLVLIVIFMENMLSLSCVESGPPTCELKKLRVRVTIPVTVTCFFSQLVVVVDDNWSWMDILTKLRRFFIKCNPSTSTVAPAPENNSESPNDPTNAEPNLFAV